jgi:hypothetical protein
MANLLSIAELAWKQLFPEGSDETKVDKEQFIADSKTEYSYQLWLKILADKREEGQLDIPSYLLTETELEVVDNVIDLKGLKIMRSIPFEAWLQNVGGIDCKCRYVKTTFNLAQVLCDDDSLDDTDKTYYAVGKKIKFPRGVHKSPLPITYANNGEKVDGMIEVDDAVGGLVRRSLIELYAGKVGKEDKTNNSSSDT